MEDTEILKRIAGRDKAVFKSVVQQYQTSIFRTCFRILGNRNDAEEAAQDVFVKLYQKAGSFRGQAKLSTWLYRIAVNISLNYRRKKKVISFFDILSLRDENKPAHEYDPPDSTSSQPDIQMEQQHTRNIIKKSLDSLPSSQRTAFVLHKYEGLSYKNVSDIMKISLSSVESLIHRAKIALRKKISMELENE